MRNLVTIHLHGALAEKYGAEHAFHIQSAREAVSALDANYPGFRRDFRETPEYGLIIDGDCRHPGNCDDPAGSPIASDLHFVPMIEGEIAGAVVGAFAMFNITISTATASIISSALVIGLSLGVSMLLAPKVETPKTEKQTGYAFSGPDNVVEQGAAVPVIYGRCFVGSVVISAGLEVANAFHDANQRSYDWFTPENPTREPTYSDLIENPLPDDVPNRFYPPRGRRYIPGNA